MMDSQPAIDFRFTEVAQHPERLSQIRYLLTDSGLGWTTISRCLLRPGPEGSWWAARAGRQRYQMRGGR